ncbi:MAG: Unknown protein [uncultured Aureispira sp.]|uniref:Uncharacterized protein n=1 Tax=uncultured Aureispira sp. TaxID=1331704 RepID=A0A6S6ULS5_9BACT|nr:MAG: Unknown protein [uncultured Aureispira sp.]
MNVFINNQKQLLGLLLLITLVCRCAPEPDYRTTRKGPSDSDLMLQDAATIKENLALLDKTLKGYQEGVYLKNWTYDPVTNNITFGKNEDKEARNEAINHKLGLGFTDYIAKENKKTLKYQAVSPFANMEDVGLYGQPLLLNGVPFSGVLVGTHIASEKRILEARFYEGKRLGTFNVWTNLERLYTKSFQEKNVIAIDRETLRKPIIYLYPETAQDINVKVHFKGELTHTYPKYNASTGWNVSANPDGMLTEKTSGKAFSYLFWEGQSSFQYTLDKGFVVAGEQVADFLDEKLALMGLNRREATDFVSYWLPELEKNDFNLIHFSTEEYVQNAALEITPAPETLIRVFMVYKPLKTAVDIPTQELKKMSRKGYTVVEWGGKKASEYLN